MKLICLTGSYHRKVYDVYPPGISLGREEDNDVVIQDAGVSRYHAKIEFFDNVWYIHDINSSNGVILNQKKISGSAPLSVGDEIQIGPMTFRFADETEAAGPVAETTQADTRATVTDSRSQRTRRLTLVLAAVLTLLVVLVVAALLAPPAKPAAPPTAAPATHPLQVYYEKLAVSSERAFRYELELSGQRLRVTVDDARNGTRIEERKDLSESQEDLLRKALLTEEFLAASSPNADRRRDVLERERLLVRAGPTGNYMVIENTVPPPAFNRITGELTDYVRRELGIFAEPLPREEVIRQAQDQYLQAERWREDMSVDPANLYKAMLAYRQVIERLKWIDNQPDFHDEAIKRLREAEAVLTEKVDKLQRDAVMFRNLGQLTEARACYQQIIGLIPAPGDPRVQQANMEVIRLEEEAIRKRKGEKR